MNVDLLVEALKEHLPSLQFEIEHLPINEVCLRLPSTYLRAVVEFLVARFGVTHLSTITGEDTGREIVLLYHFWDRGGLTLRVELPLDDPSIESVQDHIPGAVFYEREIIEMLGVSINGYSGLGHLILTDDWDAAPPLRRQGGDKV
jgi:NADH-quinone oxidoreductase subunit C